jgi:hypothetical protein
LDIAEMARMPMKRLADLFAPLADGGKLAGRHAGQDIVVRRIGSVRSSVRADGLGISRACDGKSRHS